MQWIHSFAETLSRDLSSSFITGGSGGYPDVNEVEQALSILLSEAVLAKEEVEASCSGIEFDWAAAPAGNNRVLCLPVELAPALLPHLRSLLRYAPWIVDLRGPLEQRLIRPTESWKRAFDNASGYEELTTVLLFELHSALNTALQEDAEDSSLLVVDKTPLQDGFAQAVNSAGRTHPLAWQTLPCKSSSDGAGICAGASILSGASKPSIADHVINGIGQGVIMFSPAAVTSTDSACKSSGPNACVLARRLSALMQEPSSAAATITTSEEKKCVPPRPPSVSSDSVSPSACASDLHRLPLGGGYPHTWPLSELLSAWNPDVITLPAHYGRYTSLRAFDASRLEDVEEARHYRRAEVPFLLRNVKSFDAAVDAWQDDASLAAEAGDSLFHVDTNAESQHFMYYAKEGAKRDGSWEPPTGETLMTMRKWLEAARQVQQQTEKEEDEQLPKGWAVPVELSRGTRLGLNDALMGAGGIESTSLRAPLPDVDAGSLNRSSSSNSSSGVYACPLLPHIADAASSAKGLAESRPLKRALRTLFYPYANAAREVGAIPSLDWVTEKLDLWRHPEPATLASAAAAVNGSQAARTRASLATMVVPDDGAQTGLQLRFGMARVIAECHFDSGRNWIGLLKGRRRYILAPPSECGGLSILTDGPFRRHSSLDWTSEDDIARLSGARALEVVLEPGDILYLPPLWFHFIVSLDVNMQVNSRAGTSPLGGESIVGCNLSFPVTEPLGVHTSLVPPLHHLLAIANATPGYGATNEEEAASRLWAAAEAISIARRASDSVKMQELHDSVIPEGTLRKGRMGPPASHGDKGNDAPDLLRSPLQLSEKAEAGDADQDGGASLYSKQPDTCPNSAGLISEAQRVPWALVAEILAARPYEDVGKALSSVFHERCNLPTPVPEHIHLRLQQQRQQRPSQP